MFLGKSSTDRRSKTRIVVLVLAAICAIIVSAVGIESLVQPTESTPTRPLVLAGGSSRATTYNLEVVRSEASQEKGLGGRASLGPQSGMLFSYDTVAQRCFWMKGMRFNIDIVWFDTSHRVKSIVQNLAPYTYPQTYCADARYIVELPPGAATRHDLQIGQTVKF